MAQVKAVPAATADPKLGTERRVSGVKFPYYNLADSIQVAKVIFQKAGGATDRAHLAEFLDYKGTKNGSFMTRVTAAKLFKLIDQEGDQLFVTDLGKKIVAPVMPSDAQEAKVEAFLSVDLFRRIFEEYNGRVLPPEVGLRNLIEGKPYSIVPKQVTATVNVMLDSAEEAGFFAHGNRSKMLKPAMSAGHPTAGHTPAAPLHTPASLTPPAQPAHGGGGNGGGGNDGIPPAIRGLLNGLPPEGSALSAKKREALIAAFTAAVKWIYPDREDGD